MQFTEEQAAEVKEWVVKKLEHISDADSDVLADYVLALIRSDAPDEEIKKASLENLEDFLKENTAKFVDEIFETFNPKPQPPAPQQQQPQQQLPPTSIQPHAQHFPNTTPANFNNPMPLQPSVESFGQYSSDPSNRGGFGSGNFSRKRSFHEHAGEEQDSHYNRGDRSFKNPRVRRGGSMGRGDRMGPRDGRPQGPPFPQAPPTGPQQGNFSGMPPAPPPGFPPFDPNDPMAAMLALQNMFPRLPGMPPMPQVPTTSGSQGQQQSTQAGSPPNRINQRCKDYDTQGFCVLGSTCPYQHGSNHAVAPEDEEYDPTNAKIIDTKATNGTNGQRSPFRGNGRDRGRGRGRGGRGDFGSQRRNRADFSLAGPNEDKSITTIVVEQIPEEKFNEQSVREFFSEFGEIVEVTLQAYKHLALVKYDSYPAAKRAWSSPKVIFDNRFVKVYWYKPSAKTETGGSRPSAPAESRPEEPAFDKEEFEKQQADAQKAYEEKMQKRKEAEEAREALDKQREELFKKQQEEKAKLMQRLGEKDGGANSSNGGTPQREGSQENGKSPAENDNASEQTKALRAQLASLEAEAKSLGIDPENNPESSSRGRGRGRGGYRGGRGSFPPRGRGGYDPSYRGGYRGRGAPRGSGRGGVLRLDNRPKRVAISGVQFDTARDEALRQFLVGLGGFENIEQNPDRPDSQIVAFKDRYMAEQLMYGTSDIPSVGKVEFSWVANPPISTTAAAAAGGTPHGQSEEDTMMGGASEGGAANEHDPLAMRKDVNHEVDYDVAEVDDGWGIE